MNKRSIKSQFAHSLIKRPIYSPRRLGAAAGLPPPLQKVLGSRSWTQDPGSQRVICRLSPTPGSWRGASGRACPTREVPASGPAAPLSTRLLWCCGEAAVSSELLITFPALKFSPHPLLSSSPPTPLLLGQHQGRPWGPGPFPPPPRVPPPPGWEGAGRGYRASRPHPSPRRHPPSGENEPRCHPCPFSKNKHDLSSPA